MYAVAVVAAHARVNTMHQRVQVVVRSAASLTELTNDRVIPLDYLAVLMLLFLLMVADRLVYTLGWHAGKVPRACVWNSELVNYARRGST